jgi:hypothetical protein
MAGNVKDLIAAAHVAGTNRQAALDASRAVAAQVAASRPVPPAAPAQSETSAPEPNTTSS